MTMKSDRIKVFVILLCLCINNVFCSPCSDVISCVYNMGCYTVLRTCNNDLCMPAPFNPVRCELCKTAFSECAAAMRPKCIVNSIDCFSGKALLTCGC